MSENAVKQAFYRLRQRYRLLLREEIAHTVAVPGDVEDELRHFILYCKHKDTSFSVLTNFMRPESNVEPIGVNS